MARVDNLTPYAAIHLPSLSFEDQRLAVVVVAARFTMPLAARDLEGPPALAEEQPPVPLVDEYNGEAGVSSLRCEGQTAHLRPGTDIYLEGYAWAPNRRPSERSTVAVTVGTCVKTVDVVGDRSWVVGGLGLGPSRPQRFTALPLVYERCFGGRLADVTGADARASEHNPVGRGLFVRARDAIDQLLPNFEQPGAAIGSISDRPLPAGFGPVARSWRPRREYAGTYDDAWQRTRAPLWPRDVDPRFMNAAASGLVAHPRLTGGEAVRLVGVHPDGPIRFPLPRLALQAKFDLRRRPLLQPMQLDGLRLAPAEGCFTLYFRASAVVEPDPFALERIVVREIHAWERG
jgi:hypothetical protein